MIYASRPERGLQYLLASLWPRIRAYSPEAELYICTYEVDLQALPPKVRNIYQEIDRLIRETPGVVALGNLTKEAYYGHLAEAQLMLYPCDFPEISCIVALEAQACRTPIITTDNFALRETVGVKDWLIGGNPWERAYQDPFIARVKNLLATPSFYEATVQRGYDWVVPKYTWAVIAQEWSELFDIRNIDRRPQSSMLILEGR